MSFEILLNWGMTGLGTILLGASVPMLWTGRFPPPAKAKAHPVLSTAILVVGMTMLLKYGSPDLLQATLDALGGK